MKRFLSTLLVLALIISLVPVTFAAEGETETPVRIFYSVGTDSKEMKESGFLTALTKEYTHGFYRYAGTSSTTVDPETSAGHLQARNNFIQVNNDIAVSFEIYVPVAGTYTMEMYNGEYSGAGWTGVYLTTLDKLDLSKYKDTDDGNGCMIVNAEVMGERMGEYLCYNANIKNIALDTALRTTPNYIPGFKFDEPGWYVLSFEGELNYITDESGEYVKDEDGKNVSTGGYGTVGDFYLTMEDGVDVPMTIDPDVVDDKTSLEIGETAQMTATAYMSDGSAAPEGYTVSYTSSDENIATVAENGLVTAKAYGVNPVTITASATIDGYTVENSEEITVNADGIEIKYNVGTDLLNNKDKGFLTALTYDQTNGFYKYYGTSSNTSPITESGGHLKLQRSQKGLQVNNAITASFEVYIPQVGSYTMKMWNNEYKGGGTAEIWVSTADKVDLTYRNEKLGEKIGEYSCYKEGEESFTVRSEPNVISGFDFDTPGWYVLSFKGVGGYAYVGDFTLISGTGSDPVAMPAMIKLGADELDVGDTTTAEAIKYLSDGNPAEGATFSDVTSSNSDVVTVDETGSVEAKRAGTATLSATVTYNGTPETLTREVTVVDKPAGQTVSFAADNVGTLCVNNEEKEYTDLSLLSLNRGDTVKVVADTSDTTKTFRGWVRGAADSGRLVSNSTEYEFTAMTHTMLTAVYSDNTETGNDVVEYYGWNEQYITTLPASEKEPTAPTLTGYEFAKWVLGKSDDNIARKVAQYTVEETTYNVSVQDGVSVSVEGGKYVYDAKVTCTANEDVYWYRDNVLVDYGTTYSFYIWDNTSITTKSTGNNGVKIMLDKSKSGEFMVEYDAGNEEIVEVGLIFGGSSDITIDNCSDKMNSQRNGVHGQFTASKGDNTTARGYLIYNDNGTYRVIYAN